MFHIILFVLFPCLSICPSVLKSWLRCWLVSVSSFMAVRFRQLIAAGHSMGGSQAELFSACANRHLNDDHQAQPEVTLFIDFSIIVQWYSWFSIPTCPRISCVEVAGCVGRSKAGDFRDQEADWDESVPFRTGKDRLAAADVGPPKKCPGAGHFPPKPRKQAVPGRFSFFFELGKGKWHWHDVETLLLKGCFQEWWIQKAWRKGAFFWPEALVN